MTDNIIITKDLKKQYGKTEAVNGLNLEVPRGSVFGFLGRNGAGKTTTIKILLGLLDNDSGSAEVLGFNPKKEKGAVDIRKKTGYVSENPKMYEWMKINELVRFTKSFYKNWDDAESAALLNRFNLDGNKKLKELSRGMYSQVALLLALSFKPELLVLDEPTSGLDAIVRRDFLESVVSIIQEEGRTVFFSSHQINEVERVADRVGIIDKCRMLVTSTVDNLKAKTKKIRLVFKDKAILPDIKSVICSKTDKRETILVSGDFTPGLAAKLKADGVEKVDVYDMPLEDIFIAYTGEKV